MIVKLTTEIFEADHMQVYIRCLCSF